MKDLSQLRLEANEAEGRLRMAVIQACPGPHQLIQHRDGNEAWCRKCGRGIRGNQIKIV